MNAASPSVDVCPAASTLQHMADLNRLAARTSVFTESVIREMTRLAIVHGAINLAQGYPDFPAPDFIKQAAIDASTPTSTSTRSPGARRACARRSPTKTKRFYGIDFDPEREITVTCGATEA